MKCLVLLVLAAVLISTSNALNIQRRELDGKPRLTDKQIEEARSSFDKVDKSKDGHITFEELMRASEANGHYPTDAVVQETIDRSDNNSNGKIEFNEFLAKVAETYEFEEQQQQNKLREAFKDFDRDDNGFITSQEIMATFGVRTYNEKVGKMMHEADTNKDEKVDYLEFVKVATAKNG